MVTATTTMTAKMRSLKLALTKGHTNCSHAARTLVWALDEDGILASLTLEIQSARSDATYGVVYLAAADDGICDCRAALFGRPCWHRGLGILCGRAVAQLYTAVGRAAAERAYHRDLSAHL